MDSRAKNGQFKLTAGPVPMRAGPVDVQGIQAGVTALGSLARAARRGEPLPERFRPNLDGMELGDQVATVWRAYALYSVRATAGRADQATAERLRRVVHFYEELSTAGYRLQRADAIGQRHIKVLLQIWRDAGKSVGTIRSQWSTLRIWALALGKGGLVQSLEAYWPNAPKAALSDDGKRAAKLQDRKLDEAQMSELMRAPDPTHWLVERLRRELGLTLEESLFFDHEMATQYLKGRLLVRSSTSREYRSVPVGGHEQLLLVQQVEQVMAERGRCRLMWPDSSLQQALRRHQNRLAYLRRKSPREPAAPQGGDGHE